MELKIPDKKMFCLDYPGIIVNPDKALQTLGGLRNLKHVRKNEIPLRICRSVCEGLAHRKTN